MNLKEYNSVESPSKLIVETEVKESKESKESLPSDQKIVQIGSNQIEKKLETSILEGKRRLVVANRERIRQLLVDQAIPKAQRCVDLPMRHPATPIKLPPRKYFDHKKKENPRESSQEKSSRHFRIFLSSSSEKPNSHEEKKIQLKQCPSGSRCNLTQFPSDSSRNLKQFLSDSCRSNLNQNSHKKSDNKTKDPKEVEKLDDSSIHGLIHQLSSSSQGQVSKINDRDDDEDTGERPQIKLTIDPPDEASYIEHYSSIPGLASLSPYLHLVPSGKRGSLQPALSTVPTPMSTSQPSGIPEDFFKDFSPNEHPPQKCCAIV